ncbi:MAG: HNH endonuclease [Solirubrobacteraceae bacterium]
MARRRKQSWEEKLGEVCMAGGAAIGLMSAASAASQSSAAAPACKATKGHPGACVSHAITDTFSPYLKAGLTGAIVGLLIAVVLALTWRYMRGAKSGPFAVKSKPAVKRETISERVRHEVWRRERGTCVDCGSRGRLEFDHIIPVSKGGSSTVRNLEIRCQGCNRSKGARI